MKPFVINRYGRMVFPSNFFPNLDFSVFETLDQFAAVIRRDFEEKAPSEADIVSRLESGAYRGRYDLLRDLALDLFWVNRFALTMYEKRPTRWRDVPRQREYAAPGGGRMAIKPSCLETLILYRHPTPDGPRVERRGGDNQTRPAPANDVMP